jgi:hypothetical protein
MGRLDSFQTYKPKVKRLAPAWRGIGCVLLLIFTVGAYWLGGVVLSANKKTPFIPVQLGADIGFTMGPIEVPVGIALAGSAQPPQGRVVTMGPVNLMVGTLKFYVSWMQLALTAIVDVLIFGIMVIVWGLANPYKPGPTDAPPVRPRKGRQKSLTR